MSAGFKVIPGRYYYAMWYLELPPIPEATSGCIEGGNVVVLLWRLDNELTHWHLQYRFCYYRNKTKMDERVWHELKIEGQDLEKLKQAVNIMLEALAKQGREFGLDATPQQLLIDGDNNKFFEIVDLQKPYWMNHLSTVLSA